MKKYLLITASEDGAWLQFLNAQELDKALGDAESGISEFFQALPDDQPAYWGEQQALLLRVELLTPKPVSGFALPKEQQENPVIRGGGIQMPWEGPRRVKFHDSHGAKHVPGDPREVIVSRDIGTLSD